MGKPFSKPGDGFQPATPLESMDYLDGYLDHLYTSDMPDGAWFQSQVDAIAAHWPDEKDAHDCFMAYLQWKSKQGG